MNREAPKLQVTPVSRELAEQYIKAEAGTLTRPEDLSQIEYSDRVSEQTTNDKVLITLSRVLNLGEFMELESAMTAAANKADQK